MTIAQLFNGDGNLSFRPANGWDRSKESNFKTFAHLFSYSAHSQPLRFVRNAYKSSASPQNLLKNVRFSIFRFYIMAFCRWLFRRLCLCICADANVCTAFLVLEWFAQLFRSEIFGKIVKKATHRRATIHAIEERSFWFWAAWIPWIVCACCDWLFELLLFNQMAYSSEIKLMLSLLAVGHCQCFNAVILGIDLLLCLLWYYQWHSLFASIWLNFDSIEIAKCFADKQITWSIHLGK